MRKVTHTKWVNDDGFAFQFEPVEESLSIKKTKEGFEARYLAQDECYDTGRDEDDCLFLVHYHRSYWIERKSAISADDLRSWYQGEKIEQEKSFHIFAVSALIHSGVWLKLGQRSFESDSMGWDTSHVGAVLAAKKEFKTRKRAEKAAESLIDEANKINSGEVFLIVKEAYTKAKEPIDYDVVGGHVGLKYALNELKGF